MFHPVQFRIASSCSHPTPTSNCFRDVPARQNVLPQGLSQQGLRTDIRESFSSRASYRCCRGKGRAGWYRGQLEQGQMRLLRTPCHTKTHVDPSQKQTGVTHIVVCTGTLNAVSTWYSPPPPLILTLAEWAAASAANAKWLHDLQGSSKSHTVWLSDCPELRLATAAPAKAAAASLVEGPPFDSTAAAAPISAAPVSAAPAQAPPFQLRLLHMDDSPSMFAFPGNTPTLAHLLAAAAGATGIPTPLLRLLVAGREVDSLAPGTPLASSSVSGGLGLASGAAVHVARRAAPRPPPVVPAAAAASSAALARPAAPSSSSSLMGPAPTYTAAASSSFSSSVASRRLWHAYAGEPTFDDPAEAPRHGEAGSSCHFCRCCCCCEADSFRVRSR